MIGSSNKVPRLNRWHLLTYVLVVLVLFSATVLFFFQSSGDRKFIGNWESRYKYIQKNPAVRLSVNKDGTFSYEEKSDVISGDLISGPKSGNYIISQDRIRIEYPRRYSANLTDMIVREFEFQQYHGEEFLVKCGADGAAYPINFINPYELLVHTN
jgi:hypothetical protein